MRIAQKVRELKDMVPPRVRIMAVAKKRTPEELAEVVRAGITLLGENYYQEAVAHQEALRKLLSTVEYASLEWRFIGHLQSNKIAGIVERFHAVETLASLKHAGLLLKAAAEKKRMPLVLLEINSGREPAKHGLFPEDAENLVREISRLGGLQINGLMTMGPAGVDASAMRACFRETRILGEKLGAAFPNCFRALEFSMGMSASFAEAIAEGATEVRIGTALFGPRS
jgi:pyridoxal phosphate enzyme (YggS family)